MRLHLASLRLVRMAALLFTCCVVALIAGCGRSDGSGSSESQQAPPAPPPTPAAVTQPPSGMDLAAVMRRVHFAFRADGDGFSGGHTTYGARATERELRVTPYLPGHDAEESEPFVAETLAVERGGVSLIGGEARATLREDATLAIQRGGVVEHLENGDEGVEQSFEIASAPAGHGDLTVRIAVSGLEYTGETEHGLHFADAVTGIGVRYGRATWVDAKKRRTDAPVAFDGGAITITVPASVLDESAYPAVLDPTIGPEIGMDNPVSMYAVYDQSEPAIAFGSANFLVVWRDTRVNNTGGDIYGARVSPAGTILDVSGILISNAAATQATPAVAWNGTEWMVTWIDLRNGANFELYGARVSANGAVLDPNGLAFEVGANHGGPSIAWDGTNYLVSWVNTTDVRAIRIASNGSPVGASFQVANTPAPPNLFGASVAFNGANYLVAYAYYNNAYRVGAKRVSPAGSVIDAVEISLATTQGAYYAPAVATEGVNWLVAWPKASAGTIYGQRVQANGTPLDGANGFIVANYGVASVESDKVSLTYGGNAYGVFWTQNGDVYAARVSTGGVVLATQSNLIGESGSHASAVAAHDGANYLVAWRDNRLLNGSTNGTDIFGARINSSLAKVDASSKILSQASNAQMNPSVAYNGTNYLAVWEDYRPGAATSDIYGTRISAAGTVLDASGIAISTANNSQYVPAVASNGTDWFVAWQDARAGVSTDDIYGARVLANGTALDVNGISIGGGAGIQRNPAVASDGSGYLVTWDNASLRGARVSAAGAVLDAGGFQITSSTLFSYPAGIAYSGTNYLVAWTTNTLDIFAARVTPAAVVLDPGAASIPIAATAGVNEFNPSIASDGSGWLVVWNDSSDVRGARVNAGGTLLDPAGIGVSAAANSQSAARVAWNGSEYWVIWRDTRVNVSLSDIYGTRMSAAGAVLDAAGLVIAADPENENAPAISRGPAGSVMAIYQRYDSVQPNGAVRVRGRIISSTGNNGSACAVAGQCSSGFCVDGVCCDLACSGTCQACTAAKKGGGADGACGSIGAGSDPDNECSDQGAASCGTNGSCNGSGACTLYAAGTSCGANLCVGNSATPKMCDGAGTCVNGAGVPCAPYICAAGACKTMCMSINDCDVPNTCVGGVCTSFLADGAACSMGTECQSGSCVDGVCCNVACNGICQACTAAKKGAGADGVCGSIANGADPDNECTAMAPPTCGTTGACNGAGACALHANGVSCGAVCVGNSATPKTCDGAGTCVNGAGVACSPYACANGTCNVTCVNAGDCAAGFSCVAGVCGNLLANGAACGANAQCQSGSCVDGVCCNSACGALCQACSAAKKGGGADGVCGAIASGADPDSECASQAQSTCGTTGVCNGASACQLYTAGTSCGSPICQGNVVKSQTCDGSGTCGLAAGGQACSPYACTAGACKVTCAGNGDCALGFVCSQGACTSPLVNGAACGAASECQSGNCVDGVCCNTACNGACQACTSVKIGGGSDGTCGSIASGTDPDSECAQQAQNSCGQTGQCNGAGACQLYAQGISCGVSVCQGSVVKGQICNGSGVCITDQVGQDCAPFICSSGTCLNPCVTGSDCLPGNFCLAGACKPNGSDGMPCASALECSSGLCVDGVCCNSACNGTCQACSAAKKGQGSDGACESIKNNTDPDNECAVQVPSTCKQNGTCNGNGACGQYVAGTQCAAPSCAGTQQSGASTCDGMGTCVAGSTTSCVEGYVCVGTMCATSCSDDSSCAPGYTCDLQFQACAPSADAGPPDSGTGGGGAGGTGGTGGGTGGSGTGGGATGGGGTGGSGTGGKGGSGSGTGGNGTGGATGGAGGHGTGGRDTTESKGCGCEVPGDDAPRGAPLGAALFALGVLTAARRRRRAA